MKKLIKMYKNLYVYSFDFQGKSTRTEFWILWISNRCINLIFEMYVFSSIYACKAFLMGLLMAPRQTILKIPPVKSDLVFGIWALYVLSMLIPMIAISFRRFNDAGVQKRWYIIIIVGKFLLDFIIIRGMINQIIYVVTFMIFSLLQFYLLSKPSKEPG